MECLRAATALYRENKTECYLLLDKSVTLSCLRHPYEAISCRGLMLGAGAGAQRQALHTLRRTALTPDPRLLRMTGAAQGTLPGRGSRYGGQ